MSSNDIPKVRGKKTKKVKIEAAFTPKHGSPKNSPRKQAFQISAKDVRVRTIKKLNARNMLIDIDPLTPPI